MYTLSYRAYMLQMLATMMAIFTLFIAPLNSAVVFVLNEDVSFFSKEILRRPSGPLLPTIFSCILVLVADILVFWHLRYL